MANSSSYRCAGRTIVPARAKLANHWDPSTQSSTETRRGCRVAAFIVLAITGLAWLFWRGVAGYVGGCAWFLLLFLPAIGLRKMTELATQGNYDSARKLGAALQILHPSPELRNQIRLFRRLESQANHRAAADPVPIEYETTRRARGSQLRNARAVLILILLN